MRKLIRTKTVQDSLVVGALGIALICYSVYKVTTARVKSSWMMSPYLFPILLGVFVVLLAVSMFFEGRHEARKAQAQEDAVPEAKEQQKPKLRIVDILVVIALSVLFDVVMRWIGFLPATALYLAAMILFLGERRWQVVLPVAVLTPAALYLIFTLALNVRLP